MTPTFHHVGLVLPSLDQANKIAVGLGMLKTLHWEPVPAFECFCAFLDDELPMIELVVPLPTSRLAAFLERPHDSVLHHVAFSLPERPAGLERMTRAFHLFRSAEDWLFPVPQQGARGLWVNFLKPQHGLLQEYVLVP